MPKVALVPPSPSLKLKPMSRTPVVVGIVFLVTPGPGIPLIYVGWRLVAGAAS